MFIVLPLIELLKKQHIVVHDRKLVEELVWPAWSKLSSPGNNNDAIPLDATVRTMWFSERNAEANVFQMKVLPVPP
ncbi:hypothetical protein Lal_00019960 [Lupinus albus]|nr:hypothetical protein Lal_00019960 [Lupinus albus]